MSRRAAGFPRKTSWLALVVLVAGCAGTTPTADDAGGLSGELVVFAAASLTESFAELADRFETAHPQITVTVNAASSSALAQQIVAGAPADVFASASEATMRVVSDAGQTVGNPRIFARNLLQIAVPPGDPGAVTGLSDFARDELTLAVCAVQVPCGAAASAVFGAADISPAPDTLEQDVKAVLAKVRLGEVDAGLVYVTDVHAAGEQVEGIAFPEAEQTANDYPVTALAEAPNPAAATAFVDLLLSAEGRAVLADAAFALP